MRLVAIDMLGAMAKFLAIAVVLFGLALGLRGLYVWTGCGYDCPALSFPNITATAAILYGGLAGAAGFCVLLAAFLRASDRGT